MRAAVVPRHGPAQVIEIRDNWPEPGPPGEDEVLIAVEAAGLNPSDTKIRARGGLGMPGSKEPPYVAGREAAGTLLECGPVCKGWRQETPSSPSSAGLPVRAVMPTNWWSRRRWSPTARWRSRSSRRPRYPWPD